MLQLITEILGQPNDPTQLRLLFANQTEEDILVRDELEKLQAEHPDQFKLWYTVDRPVEGNYALRSYNIFDPMPVNNEVLSRF